MAAAVAQETDFTLHQVINLCACACPCWQRVRKTCLSPVRACRRVRADGVLMMICCTVSATTANTVDELIMLAAACPREVCGGEWWCYSFVIVCPEKKKFFPIKGQLEDLDILKKTVAELIAENGPIQSILITGSMRGSCKYPVDFRAGESMLDCLSRGAPVYSGWKAQQDKMNAATEPEPKSQAGSEAVGEVTFDDTDGDRSTLRMSTGGELSWHAGGHCLIAKVCTLRFSKEDSTLTCPQPINATPFTNGRTWATLTAVLEPGESTDALLERIKALVASAGATESIDLSF